MKYKYLILFLFFSFFTLTIPYSVKAQAVGTCINDNGTPAGNPSPNTTANNGCPDGSALVGPNGRSGATVPNNLTYTQLEPLPGENATQTNFCGLLNLLFKIFIYIGGMIAVLFLVLGGITYMISEVVDKRSKARERIKASVWGLLILLSSWIILNTVNPQLVGACNILNPTTTGVINSAQGIAADQAAQMQKIASQCQSSGKIIQTIPAGSNPQTLCQTSIPLVGTVNLPSCGSLTSYVTACCDAVVIPTSNSPGAICVSQ